MGEEEKKEQGFRVSDRRRFAVSETGESGGLRESDKEKEKPPEPREAKTEPEKKKPVGEAQSGRRPQADRKQEPSALPEINFSTFVVSLASSALIHLGIAPDPMSGKTNKDLPLAKQTIDMLGMLQEKTRGNLSEEEGQLLDSMLYDLRMRYVAESR
jgi:hypothetical protein